MSKLVFASIIAVIISFVGLRVKAIYKSRLVYLEDYSTFLNELIEEISFYKSPIYVFIDRVMATKHKEFARTLGDYRESIKTGSDVTISNTPLRSSDAIIIQNCFNGIGRYDAETEIFNIKYAKNKGESMLKIAREELTMKGELISKLCILLGIALMILLV